MVVEKVLKLPTCTRCGKRVTNKLIKLCADCKKKPEPKKPRGFNPKVKIKSMLIKEIKRAEYNPRIPLYPGDAEYEALTASLVHFGYAGTLIVNEVTGNLVSGHQRLTVLQREFKVKRVDVQIVRYTLAEEKAANIALNQIKGQWDIPKLKTALKDIVENTNVDAILTGFDMAQIDKILGRNIELTEPPEQKQTKIETTHKVEVICIDEMQQEQIYKRLTGLKMTCRKITLKPKEVKEEPK